MFAEHVSVETLRSMLMGDDLTQVKIALAKKCGTEYSVKVMRHRFHAFDKHYPEQLNAGDASLGDEPLSTNQLAVKTRQRVTRSAPPPRTATTASAWSAPLSAVADKTALQTSERAVEKSFMPAFVLATIAFSCFISGAFLLLASHLVIHGEEIYFFLE